MAKTLAFDQAPPGRDWERVRAGLWRRLDEQGRPTGEVWRGWRQYGPRAGHYPDFFHYRRIARMARAAESRFAQQLRGVGRTVGDIVRGIFDPSNPADPGWQQIEEALARYRGMLGPWAEAVAGRMLADISRRDASGWHRLGLEIGRALKQEVERAPTAQAMGQLHGYMVEQILKLPDDASERLRQSRAFSAEIVRQMRGPAEEAMVAGRRWEGLTRQVREAGLHVQSSANTVARTETARAATTLQAVRAKHIGSELFQWLHTNDADVRPLHRELARRNVGFGMGIYRWDDPPLLDDDRPGLPGTIWNCRCWAMPVLPPVPE